MEDFVSPRRRGRGGRSRRSGMSAVGTGRCASAVAHRHAVWPPGRQLAADILDGSARVPVVSPRTHDGHRDACVRDGQGPPGLIRIALECKHAITGSMGMRLVEERRRDPEKPMLLGLGRHDGGETT